MNWSNWAPIAQTVGTLSAMLTVLALIVGGGFALARYRREVRLRAADLLMKMEEEYRTIVRTCLDFEFIDRYQEVIVPVLKKVEDGTMQLTDDIEKLARLDRCLRFFFLCTVLNADLKVEEAAIARAYYYYVCVLAEPGKEMRATNVHRQVLCAPERLDETAPEMHGSVPKNRRLGLDTGARRTMTEWKWKMQRMSRAVAMRPLKSQQKTFQIVDR
jgi:hypothetical protein